MVLLVNPKSREFPLGARGFEPEGEGLETGLEEGSSGGGGGVGSWLGGADLGWAGVERERRGRER